MNDDQPMLAELGLTLALRSVPSGCAATAAVAAFVLGVALNGAEAACLLNTGLRLMDKATSLPLSECWETCPNEIVTRAEVERVLRAVGLPHARLGDPPAWGDLCAVFAPYSTGEVS